MEKRKNRNESSASRLKSNLEPSKVSRDSKKEKAGFKGTTSRSSHKKRSKSVSPVMPSKSKGKFSHLRSQETKIYPDPIGDLSTERNLTSHNQEIKNIKQVIQCPKHQQPFTMFHKKTNDLICTVCLCSKAKYGSEILPLQNAEGKLKQQNKVQLEEARVMRQNLEQAWRTVNSNRQIFEQQIEIHKKKIRSFFIKLNQELKTIESNSIRMCTQFLDKRIDIYTDISSDLHYISDKINEFEESSNGNCSLQQLTYLHSSYKLLKQVIKGISFDYHLYTFTDVNLVSFNENLLEKIQTELIGFSFILPLKSEQQELAMKQNLSDQKIKPKQSSKQRKKQKFSICHGALENREQQSSLYHRLLKSKFNL